MVNPSWFFNADLDPAFLLLQIWIRIQGAKPMRIHADPDTGHTLKSQKVELLHENILEVCNSSK